MAALEGKKIAVLGGGLREIELVKALHDAGAILSLASIQASAQLRLALSKPQDAIYDADALVLPVSGVTGDGRIKETADDEPIYVDAHLLSGLRPGAPVVVGKANLHLKGACTETGCSLVELVDDDEFAILNAIPTAEGALVVAIESSSITLHGSQAYILGYGRCGMAIARLLQGVGAKVHVVERSPVKRAMAMATGADAYSFDDLRAMLAHADFIFNTVPSLILTTEVLEAMQSETLIVDIASSPGGVDFAAAKALGIQAVLALGLPGRYAPKTAGKILAAIVPRKLAGFFA